MVFSTLPHALIVERLLKWLCSTVLLGALTLSAWAQDFEATSLLSAADIHSLRAQLQQQPPASQDTKTLQQWYAQQDEAAFRLGDPGERERVLRAWYAALPGLDSQWTLGSFLIEMSGHVSEGFRLLEDLLKPGLSPHQAVRLRARLAFGYLEEHQLSKAQAMLDAALAIIQREFPRSRGGAQGFWLTRAEMEYYRTQARLSLRQGRFDVSLDQAQRATQKGQELKQFERFIDKRQVEYGRIYHSLAATEVAVTLTQAGRLYAAEDALREAYAVFKSYHFTDDKLVGFYRFVADLYFAQGRYQDALKLARQAQAIQKRTGLADSTVQSVWTRLRINRNLIALGRWAEVAQEFEAMDRAVASNDRAKPIARMTDQRALVQLNLGNTAEAIKIYQGWLQWSVDNFGADHYFTAFTRGLYAVALSHSSAHIPEALKEFERAIQGLTSPDALSTQYDETPFRLAQKQAIYKTYLRLLLSNTSHQTVSASQAFAVSGHLMNTSVQQAIVDAAARAAIKHPGLGEIARLDQDAKAELTSLYGLVASHSSDGRQSPIKPEVLKLVQERVGELEQLRRGYKTRIQAEFPEYFQLLQPRSPTPKDIAALLSPGDVFLSIVPAEQETYLFAIEHGGQVRSHRSTLPQAEIARLVKTLRASLDVAELGSRAPPFNLAVSHRLYQELISPFAAMLKGKDHLIVATSGTLGQLPFSVLTRSATAGEAATIPWLIRDVAVSHITSPSAWMALKRMGQSPSAAQSLMAWGDPVFGNQSGNSASVHTVRSVVNTRALRSADFDQPLVDQVRYAELPPLPETRDEVLALAKVLQADTRKDVLLGKDATRDSVIQANEDGRLHAKQVLVFATHGLLAGDLPRLDQPALAMASTLSAAESPLLTLEDVMGLRLNADWVVLSACNTAGSDGKVEEALSGLARGFFYAGSRSLLVTHWSVESESAKQLTTRTFELYKNQARLSRAQALRQSMLALMQTPQFSHPTYWAPYALVGEGGR